MRAPACAAVKNRQAALLETAQKTFVRGQARRDLSQHRLPKANSAPASRLRAVPARRFRRLEREARRLIKAPAQTERRDNRLTENRKIALAPQCDGVIKLSFGKKRHVVVAPGANFRTHGHG